MGLFKLVGNVTVSVHTTVEADTLEEAIEDANNREVESAYLNGIPSEVWINDELDGMVLEIREE